MRKVVLKSQFERDWRKWVAGNPAEEEARRVMTCIAEDRPLAPKNRDHPPEGTVGRLPGLSCARRFGRDLLALTRAGGIPSDRLAQRIIRLTGCLQAARQALRKMWSLKESGV